MRQLLILCLVGGLTTVAAQTKVNPVIKSTGGIYAMPEATVLPDPDLDYRLVVDVVSGAELPDSVGQGLYRVARMINLFAVAGVPAPKMDVVLALHGGATYGVMNNDAYRERYGVNNPNLKLLQELKQAGVRITVCGQSLIGREVAIDSVAPEVEIATSMLTTVAMYQMKGYGLLRF